MDHKWAINLEVAAIAAGTAFFFKQSAAFRTEMGIELDGRIVRKYPTPQFNILR
jgi:protein gp37